jgi:hypothetical protein
MEGESIDADGKPQRGLVREAALWACLITVLGSAWPMIGSVRQIMTTGRAQLSWWMLPILLLSFLVLAALPVFYVMLHRDADTFEFRDNLRLPALFVAMLLSILVLGGTGFWVASILQARGSTVLAADPSPVTWNNLFALGMQLAAIAPALVLFAFWRETDIVDAFSGQPSKGLRIVVNMTVICWGLWLLFLTARLFLVPITHGVLEQQASAMGRRAPTLHAMFAEALHLLILEACTIAAPVFVWVSLRRKSPLPVEEPQAEAIPEP